jgi:hypothetical protein
MRVIALWLSPAAFAIERVVQCVARSWHRTFSSVRLR